MCIIFVILVLLMAAVIMDFFFDKIYNEWILVLFMTGMPYTVWIGGFEGFIKALVSMTIPIFLLYPLFMIGVIGAGDVKLLSVMGSFFTVREIFICVFISFLLGAVFSLLKMAAEKNFLQRLRYLLSYVCDVFKNKEWKLYETHKNEFAQSNEPEKRKERNKGKIHFALPIMLSVMLLKGGIILL
ncbi:A24 family peptidase [Kineothrix alysoides]|nr:A24 family peptidase [Kineothrix alysoides]